MEQTSYSRQTSGGSSRPESLIPLLLRRLGRLWVSLDVLEEGLLHEPKLEPAKEEDEDRALAQKRYRTRDYLRRRSPLDVASVLNTMSGEDLNHMRQTFGHRALGLLQFTQAIVRTGTYDSSRILAFVGGVVDLFLEVVRSQADCREEGWQDDDDFSGELLTEDQALALEPRTQDGSKASSGGASGSRSSTARTINWRQLMNHLHQLPELAMFEGNEAGAGRALKAMKEGGREGRDKLPQLRLSSFIDIAKHEGTSIYQIYWAPYLEMIFTCEGSESVCFWSPNAMVDKPVLVTPQLPPCFFDNKGQQNFNVESPLWSVLAAAWDNDTGELAVLLSNRMLVLFAVRNKKKGQFQQKKAYRFIASRDVSKVELDLSGKPISEGAFTIALSEIDRNTGEDLSEANRMPVEEEDIKEREMLKQRAEQRQAAEEYAQLNIWWNPNIKIWITTDRFGRLFLWDLRNASDMRVMPEKVLAAHSRLVTSHLELNKFRFTTGSLDRSVIVWDARPYLIDRSTIIPEVRIPHLGCVLSQAYLPLFHSLISVACEKRVYVWTVDPTGFRGVKAKLSSHQANLVMVSAGQKVFCTLDESHIAMFWDGATLVNLQRINCQAMNARHVLCLLSLGLVCLAGRRLNFFEGNELGAQALGKMPTEQQLAKSKQDEAGIQALAAPRWCGMSDSRGCMFSVTEVEIRAHERDDPTESKVVFDAPPGDRISTFAMVDKQSFAVLGTEKGAVYFIKSRSGYKLKSFPGKRGDRDDWNKKAGEAGAGGKADGASPKGEAKKGNLRVTKDIWKEYQTPKAAAATAGTSPQRRKTTARASTPKISPEGGSSSGDFLDDILEGFSGQEAAEDTGFGLRPQGDGEEGERNAPTPEDVQRGMSSSITCLHACEENGKVYVGTAEGLVLVFATDKAGEWSAWRWVHRPRDSEVSPVTCLRAIPAVLQGGKEDDQGLLFVGIQDGTTHIYMLESLRWAGKIANLDACRFAGDGRGSSGDGAGARATASIMTGGAAGAFAVAHLRMFTSAVLRQKSLPFALLTVDAASRARLWGLRIDVMEGRLVNLELLWDGGQIRASDCMTDFANKFAGEKDGAARATWLGWEPVKLDEIIEERRASSDHAQFTALATLSGYLAIPATALAKQPLAGPLRAVATSSPDPKALKKLGAEDRRRREELETAAVSRAASPGQAEDQQDGSFFMTESQSADRQSPLTRKRPGFGFSSGSSRPKKEKTFSELFYTEAEYAAADGFGSCTDSDGESGDELMGRRIHHQPPAPDVIVEGRWSYVNKPGRYTIRKDPEVKDGRGWRYEESLLDGTGRVVAGRLIPHEDYLLGRLSSGPGEDKAYGSISLRRGVGDTLVSKIMPPGGDEYGPEMIAKAVATVAEEEATLKGFREGDGDSLIFLADTEGWIWCVDMAASLEAALTQSSPVRVLLPSANGVPGLPLSETGRSWRNSVRFGSGAGSSLSGQSFGERTAKSLGGIFRDVGGDVWLERAPSGPQPEALTVLGAWPAHRSPVQALVPAAGPPALVSTSMEKDVKVWSTAGDLWGHFSLQGFDSVPPCLAVWPPPQVLTVQLELMRTAKGLCGKMGFQTRKAKRSTNTEAFTRQQMRFAAGRVANRRLQEKSSESAPKAEAPADLPGAGRSDSRAERLARRRAGSAAAGEQQDRPDSGCSVLTGASSASASPASPGLKSLSEDTFNAASPTRRSKGLGASTVSFKSVATGQDLDQGDELIAGNSLMETSTSMGPDAFSQELDTQLSTQQQRREPAFTEKQMTAMIRNHAFSSGFQSYSSFARKGSRQAGHSAQSRSLLRLGVPPEDCARQKPPSAFGIECLMKGDEEAWERSMQQQQAKGMARSASEGALLNFAHNTVGEMTRHVREDLRIDITCTNLETIRRPSFPSRLDVLPVSSEPKNPTSATGQAVRRIQQSVSQKNLNHTLLSAGQMAVEGPERGVRSGRVGRR